MTYSFPCQDLSLAGKTQGMTKGSGTRSGLLWEVERILNECKDNLPQVLLMENVPQVIGSKNIDDFKQWELFLESKGYQNYIDILNGKDYEIPQNRRRCFMVSILGNYSYSFPKKQPLKLKLSDMLEKEVDEKYYLSSKMVDYISYKGTGGFTNPDSKINLDIARPLTTEQNKRAGTTNYICEELPANYDLSLRIKNATKKGYETAHVGDGIDISARMEKHRGTVQKETSQTIKTQCEVGVVTNKLQIRKLTPKECWRLMGFEDVDYEKAAQVVSSNNLYKQAGNSIIVNVLYYIFKQLL